MCFVAMPFGTRSPPGKRTPVLAFDAVNRVINAAVEAERLECIRADFELAGGFVHRPMFERLLVAEYVVADLTFANPNVAYELGVRHGGSIGATIVVCASTWLGKLPFDHAPFRVIPYRVGKNGKMPPAAATEFTEALRARLREAKRGGAPMIDNPIVQVTQLRPAAMGHEKTDVFLERMAYASEVGRRIVDALATPDRPAAIAALKTIENEVLDASEQLRQLHTAVLGLLLGYRSKSAFQEMIALWGRMSPELRETPVAREQLALATNRLAEEAARAGDFAAADRFRGEAIAAIERLPRALWTSETFAILGRIFKGQADAEQKRGRAAEEAAALTRAIEQYERGLCADPRDYFPGVNAITLRILRHRPEDEERLATLLPVVRFAVARAPEPKNEDERYWQAATRLELACAARDWPDAQGALDHLLPLRVAPWMRTTTADNLERQMAARGAEDDTARGLRPIIAALRDRS